MTGVNSDPAKHSNFSRNSLIDGMRRHPEDGPRTNIVFEASSVGTAGTDTTPRRHSRGTAGGSWPRRGASREYTATLYGFRSKTGWRCGRDHRSPPPF
jgi:hypothetical protein